MVRKVFSLFLLWMCVVASILGGKVQAQGEGRKLILRIVSAETGQAIPDVICSVWDSTHRRPAFAQTNHEGLVTFTFDLMTILFPSLCWVTRSESYYLLAPSYR